MFERVRKGRRNRHFGRGREKGKEEIEILGWIGEGKVALKIFGRVGRRRKEKISWKS